jgi:hypothetical protein
MGQLTEASFLALVESGCSDCGSKRLVFQSYVDGTQRLLGGEPDGRITWAYKGETFIDGVFEVGCANCKKALFSSPDCPRCHAPEGLAKALGSENAFPAPKACPSCQSEDLWCTAFVPATVLYEGKRAEKARTETEFYDEGFHGYRLQCRFCGNSEEEHRACPLCQAPGPLRRRPS